MPPWAKEISATCASPMIRAASGISVPLRPYGTPLPSQRSSSARMASAVLSGRSIMRAISAPRSQRVV